MLIGEYQHNLDSKNRMIIPSKLREDLGRKFIITNKDIETLIQFEYSAYDEATVPICTYVLRNAKTGKPGYYFDLSAHMSFLYSSASTFISGATDVEPASVTVSF